MRVLLELGFGLPKKAQVVKPTCTIVQLIALIDERYGEDLFATVSSLHINDHILEAQSDDDLVVDAPWVELVVQNRRQQQARAAW